MKLKKIASMMLAGVMAVSMLAGCSTTAVDPEPTPDPTPEADYGTMLWNNLNEGKKNITFQANSTLDSNLKAAVGYLGSLGIYESYWLGDTIVEVNTDGIKKDLYHVDPEAGEVDKTIPVYLADSLKGVARRLSDLTGAANEALDVSSKNFDDMEAVLNEIKPGNIVDKTDDDITAVALYVVDGSVSIEAALEQAARDLDEVFMDLDYSGNNTNQGKEYVYKYTGSVSVASKSITKDGANVNFIAVQVDRTTVQR